MKKLLYCARLFAAFLLLMQLGGCEGFPGPGPISKKYARPADELVAGMPMPNGDGKNIYQPSGKKDFRCAASMMARADGTMSAWFATPGADAGSLPEPTELNPTGPHNDINVHDEDGKKTTAAMKLFIEEDFYGWQISCPSYSSTDACFHWEIYQWDTDYNTTLQGKPLGEVDFDNYKDNAWLELNADNCNYSYASGNAKFPAGTYFLYMERTSGDAGCWANDEIFNSECWLGTGSLGGKRSYHTRIQYVAPSDVGYSSQIRYYTASSAEVSAVWADEGEVALAPAKDKADGSYATEPSVVKIGDYYYMTYTASATPKEKFDNNLFVARSTSPDKDFQKWNGTSWGGDPSPVIAADLVREDTYYGAGGSCLVVKDGQIYLYYTYCGDGIVYDIRLATADANDPNWPAALTDHGVVMNRGAYSGKNVSATCVRYIEEQGCFQGICCVDVDSPASYLAVWRSADGIDDWSQVGIIGSNTRVRIKYPCLVSDELGQVSFGVRLLTYQYGQSNDMDKSGLKTWISTYDFIR